MKNNLLEMFIENFQKTFIEVSAMLTFFLLFVYVITILYSLVNPPARWEEKFTDVSFGANNNFDIFLYKLCKTWTFSILAILKPIFCIIDTILDFMRKN
ncbi:hypothetical protein [Streptococcus suis]|uniref:hypothetical protein n=1 Tax=Streptococcus suis TaxID=1307 RepID=UPI00345C616B